MPNLDDTLIKDLRAMAHEGATVMELIKKIQIETGLGAEARLLVILGFTKAFALRMADASLIGSWIGFPGGTATDDEIELVIKPLIHQGAFKWDDNYMPRR